MQATGPKLVTPEDESVEQAEVKIEYSAELIDRIRAESVSALLSIPYGGLEIAGVLFGKRTARTLYLAAARPIHCEHAGGPSLVLSERDARDLETLLTVSRGDFELDGLEALGWYVSHTRRPPALTPSDMDIFDLHFSEPLGLAGVVQPEKTGSAKFRWFVRNDDGTVDPDQPSQEFTVQPQFAPDAIAPEQAGLPLIGRRVRRVRVSNLSLALGTLAAIVMAALVFGWMRLGPATTSAPPLRVRDTGAQLRIEWDPASETVRRAEYGMLEIKDFVGTPVRLHLGQEMIRSGRVLYNNPSNKVQIVLQLVNEKGKISESMVYFIGPEEVAAAQAEPVKIPEPVEPAPVRLQQQKPNPVMVPPSIPPAIRPAASGSSERSTAIFKPPVAKKSPAPEPAVALLEPPKIATGGAMAPIHTEVAPSIPAPVPPPVSSPPATEAPKARPQAASGRLIWTGDLRKNTVLQVGENGASTGSLNGKLPSQPVKVSVHSAQLMDGVIAIYTADANSTQRAEAPGRRNGWNVTLYKFDPKHIHDLDVVDVPSEKNNWKLGIKSLNRPVSLIVIDWQLTGN